MNGTLNQSGSSLFLKKTRQKLSRLKILPIFLQQSTIPSAKSELLNGHRIISPGEKVFGKNSGVPRKNTHICEMNVAAENRKNEPSNRGFSARVIHFSRGTERPCRTVARKFIDLLCDRICECWKCGFSQNKTRC